MASASSPNDPVFFLHHANVDRLWEGWMNRQGRTYLPTMSEPANILLGQRIDDPLISPLGGRHSSEDTRQHRPVHLRRRPLNQHIGGGRSEQCEERLLRGGGRAGGWRCRMFSGTWGRGGGRGGPGQRGR
ncbi:tyrosinase family protein [Streptomyces sp. NPDC005283]|uniref:tyrosinase family protein n=1 Tax=Streptomyces sp. NPDC005283 TaxID=3156871 RepID=UPI003452ED39